MATGLSYSWNAWRGDLFGLVAVAEFCRGLASASIEVAPPSDDADDLFSEINDLISKARDRDDRAGDPAAGRIGLRHFFAQLLALTPGSHPNTLKILEDGGAGRRGRGLVPAEVQPGAAAARFSRAWRCADVARRPAMPRIPSGHALQSEPADCAGPNRCLRLRRPREPGHQRRHPRTLSSRWIAENPPRIAGVHFKSDSKCGQDIYAAAMVFPRSVSDHRAIRALARARRG